MKKSWKKRIICVLTCIMVVNMMLVDRCTVDAHEIFYKTTGEAVPIKRNTTDGVVVLKVNADGLDDFLLNYYDDAIAAWPSVTTKVSITEVSIEESNCDLGRVTTLEIWRNMFGAEKDGMIGYTKSTSTNGYLLTSLDNAISSSKIINYSALFFNPETLFYPYSATGRKGVIVHELGHALGLGHPNTAYYPTEEASIMRQNETENNNSYYMPQTHDINDINAKY